MTRPDSFSPAPEKSHALAKEYGILAMREEIANGLLWGVGDVVRPLKLRLALLGKDTPNRAGR